MQAGDAADVAKIEKSPGGEEVTSTHCTDEVELRMSLASSQNKISELMNVNQQLMREVAQLKITVSSLSVKSFL